MKKLVRRIFAQVMFSSFYTHIVLVISILIFLFSYYSYLQRVPTNRHSIPSTAPKLSRTRSTETNVTDDDSLLFTIGARTSDVTTDEEPVRRRVLGTHRGKSSPLSRFTFINPPKPVCNYPKDPSKMMVIVVLSRGLNFDYRQVIRATWGRSGKYSSSDISVQTVFFVGTDDSVQGAVRHEQVTFNDVVEIGKQCTAPLQLVSFSSIRYPRELSIRGSQGARRAALDTLLLSVGTNHLPRRR